MLKTVSIALISLLTIFLNYSFAQNAEYFLETQKEYVDCPDLNGCHSIIFVPNAAIYNELITAGFQGGGYSSN